MIPKSVLWFWISRNFCVKIQKDSNASQVYTGKRIVETVFITDNARIVILAGIEAVIVECETTVKVVVKYSFSIGAFW